MYEVKPTTRDECKDLILTVHYAKRFPSISYYFGLYCDGVLVGCCTYGTPPSPPLRKGVAGSENEKLVLELNRLVLYNNKKNEASFLVSNSLKLLPKPSIVISFADTSQGHNGTVYKACNFGYYGLSAKRTDWKVRGQEHLHGMTVADEFRGKANRSELMAEKYGDDFYLSPRPRKHRFIFVVGTRKQKRRIMKQIKYKKQR